MRIRFLLRIAIRTLIKDYRQDENKNADENFENVLIFYDIKVFQNYWNNNAILALF